MIFEIIIEIFSPYRYVGFSAVMHKMRAEFDYDAFVICNPDGEDLEFVNSLVDTMQASPYHLKICVPWRVTDRYYCSDEHYIQQR